MMRTSPLVVVDISLEDRSETIGIRYPSEGAGWPLLQLSPAMLQSGLSKTAISSLWSSTRLKHKPASHIYLMPPS